jgi:hypothetical protein
MNETSLRWAIDAVTRARYWIAAHEPYDPKDPTKPIDPKTLRHDLRIQEELSAVAGMLTAIQVAINIFQNSRSPVPTSTEKDA